ncbi:MAG: hypothetical protein ABIP46_11995 [Polaromonas sp.]
MTYKNPNHRRSAHVSFVFCVAVLLTACSSAPKVPDWQLESKGSVERAVTAYLEGDSRVEAVEFARARGEVSSTGRIDLIARAELVRCASHVASLVFEPCAGFERLRQDAAPAEIAYADYLAGKLTQAALLPEPQRAAATGGEAAIKAMIDPLSQLVAAGAAFQAGRGSPALVQIAVDAASSQGWRRPLLAWLGVQASLADKAGDTAEAARIRRRVELTQNDKTALTPVR